MSKSFTQQPKAESFKDALIEAARTPGARRFHDRRHLIDTGDLSYEEVAAIIETTTVCKHITVKHRRPLDLLSDRVVSTLFYENSTRTRSSFELAATSLGARVLDLNIQTSSVVKGETIGDTASTLVAMGVDALIQRHSISGAAHKLVSTVPSYVSIINAGDGWNAHPTQALLDLFTILELLDSVDGKKIVIVGDVKHSRVARSNIRLLSRLGADVHACAPPPLMPSGLREMGAQTHTKLETALEGADIVMALRLQQERMQDGLIPSLGDYQHLYRIDHQRIKAAKPTVRLMHPGPVNKGVEVTTELANDPKISLINTQVTNGVAVRMAVLTLLLYKPE